MTTEDNGNLSDQLYNYVLESAGDPDNARAIIRREVKDSFLVKLYVDLAGKNGFLFFIIAENTNKVLTMYSIVGTSSALRKINPFENFEGLIIDLEKAIRAGGIEDSLSERVGRSVFRNLPDAKVFHLVNQFKEKQYKDLSMIIEEAIKEETKLKAIRVTMDIEKINCLDFYEKNNLKENYPQVRNPFIPDPVAVATSGSDPVEESAIEKFNQTLNEVFKGYGEVISCNVGISPLNGIELYKLKEGQPVFFNLPFLTTEDQNRARTMGGVDDNGKYRPIIGKFMKMMTSPKREFHILATVQDGILLHAIEKNQVKVAVAPEDSIEEEKKSSNSLYIILLSILVILGLLIIFTLR